MAIVDAATGKIHLPPISEGLFLPIIPPASPGDPDQCPPWGAAILEFRPNSKLMIVKANPDPRHGRINYTHYFLWENDHWRLLSRVPLKPIKCDQ